MLTDKDIRDIKELAYRSGMDYFVKIIDHSDKPYTYDWRVLTTESGQYNKNHRALLYQHIPYDGRTLHACVARWYNYPNFRNFERGLLYSGLPLQGLNLEDIYEGLHPDYELKNLRALDGLQWAGYRPTMIICDELISE